MLTEHTQYTWKLEKLLVCRMLMHEISSWIFDVQSSVNVCLNTTFLQTALQPKHFDSEAIIQCESCGPYSF